MDFSSKVALIKVGFARTGQYIVKAISNARIVLALSYRNEGCRKNALNQMAVHGRETELFRSTQCHGNCGC